MKITYCSCWYCDLISLPVTGSRFVCLYCAFTTIRQNLRKELSRPTANSGVSKYGWFSRRSSSCWFLKWGMILVNNLGFNQKWTIKSLLNLLVLKLDYSRWTGSISWLLMPWWWKEPGHQQPWYWLFRINRASSLGLLQRGAIHSLWPSDAIWRYRSESTVAQVMACCLTAPSHYLNQCWLIISKV